MQNHDIIIKINSCISVLKKAYLDHVMLFTNKVVVKHDLGKSRN